MTEPVCQEIVVDIRGQICPSTLLTALREINQRREALQSGSERLVILTTNRESTGTIPEAARNMGYGVSVTPEEGYYRIAIDWSGV